MGGVANGRGIHVKLLLVLLVAGLAATAALVYAGLSPTHGTLTLPAVLESTGLEGSVATSGGLVASPGVVAFGTLRPGTESPPVSIRVENAGAIPLTLRVTTAPLANAASGASFPEDAITVTRSASGPLAPGGALTLTFQLQVPSGADAWIPPGAYAGAIQLRYEEGSL